MTGLPEHLDQMGGWVHVDGLGWLREWEWHISGRRGFDIMWWHDCPPMRGEAGWTAPRHIDVTSGLRHAIAGGSLAGGDLTIAGGSGSIPCDKCGLHGWLRNGRWVPA